MPTPPVPPADGQEPRQRSERTAWNIAGDGSSPPTGGSGAQEGSPQRSERTAWNIAVDRSSPPSGGSGAQEGSPQRSERTAWNIAAAPVPLVTTTNEWWSKLDEAFDSLAAIEHLLSLDSQFSPNKFVPLLCRHGSPYAATAWFASIAVLLAKRCIGISEIGMA